MHTGRSPQGATFGGIDFAQARYDSYSHWFRSDANREYD